MKALQKYLARRYCDESYQQPWSSSEASSHSHNLRKDEVQVIRGGDVGNAEWHSLQKRSINDRTQEAQNRRKTELGGVWYNAARRWAVRNNGWQYEMESRGEFQKLLATGGLWGPGRWEERTSTLVPSFTLSC